MGCRDSALSDAFKQRPTYNIGAWVWIYNTAATIRQGTKSGTEAKVLKAKLSLYCTGPFKILAVGLTRSDSTPDDRPLAAKSLYLDLSNDMPGADAHCRVSVARCKPCTNPHDTTDLLQLLPTGLTQYVLNNQISPLPRHRRRRFRAR